MESPNPPRDRPSNPALACGAVRVELQDIEATDDSYSSRIRCDHPPRDTCGAQLGRRLLDEAAEQRRGRVMVLARHGVASGLESVGFAEEGLMEGFYEGTHDCHVMGAYPDPSRAELADPKDIARVEAILEQVGPARARPEVTTERAGVAHVEGLAELLGETFAQYPTPSDDPEYLAEAIESGVPFRMVRVEGEIVACASADLVRDARTAELTDCATRPDHRGNGYIQAILSDLMEDLRELEYPTAFTLARARIAGMNIAFQRLGFDLCGTMPKSCRIGEGIEDMNIWARPLAVA